MVNACGRPPWFKPLRMTVFWLQVFIAFGGLTVILPGANSVFPEKVQPPDDGNDSAMSLSEMKTLSRITLLRAMWFLMGCSTPIDTLRSITQSCAPSSRQEDETP
jgi:hypothetical protein